MRIGDLIRQLCQRWAGLRDMSGEGEPSEESGPEVATRRFVNQRVLAAWPNYPVLDEFHKVSALRDWVYAFCDVSRYSRVCLQEHDSEGTIYWRLPLDRVLELCDRNRLALRCAGVSHTLMRVYRAMGFRAWYYNCGRPDLISHCVALVSVRGEIYLQDATFNSELVTAEGTPLPFFSALASLQRGERLRFEVGPTRYRKVHCADVKASLWPAQHRSCSQSPRSVPGGYVHHLAYSWENYLETDLDSLAWRKVAELYHLPDSYHDLMLLPVAVFDGDDYWQDPRDCDLLARIVRASGPLGVVSLAGRRLYGEHAR